MAESAAIVQLPEMTLPKPYLASIRFGRRASGLHPRK